MAFREPSRCGGNSPDRLAQLAVLAAGRVTTFAGSRKDDTIHSIILDHDDWQKYLSEHEDSSIKQRGQMQQRNPLRDSKLWHH